MASNTATMRQVADLSGFAPATVSLALRHSPNLAAKTREQIWAAARRLGYRRNPLVSALMALRRSHRTADCHTVLALVTSHQPDDPWRAQRTFVEFVDGATRRAAELGFRLEEFPLRAAGMTPRRYLQILRTRNIHGLLINPLPHREKELGLDLKDFAVVGLGVSVASPHIERVSNDHFQSATEAVKQCLALGYRRIGFVVSREMSERLENRWFSGYLMAQHASPGMQRVAPLMPETTAEIEAALPGWCRQERPDVVLFGFFDLAYQERLPREVGIAALSVYRRNGALTGIFQDSSRIGAVAIDHLVGRLHRTDFGPQPTASVHLMAGAWAAGRTATGPGKSRPILDKVSVTRVVKRR